MVFHWTATVVVKWHNFVNRGFKPTEEVEDLSKVNLERDSETVNKEISSFYPLIAKEKDLRTFKFNVTP